MELCWLQSLQNPRWTASVISIFSFLSNICLSIRNSILYELASKYAFSIQENSFQFFLFRVSSIISLYLELLIGLIYFLSNELFERISIIKFLYLFICNLKGVHLSNNIFSFSTLLTWRRRRRWRWRIRRAIWIKYVFRFINLLIFCIMILLVLNIILIIYSFFNPFVPFVCSVLNCRSFCSLLKYWLRNWLLLSRFFSCRFTNNIICWNSPTSLSNYLVCRVYIL